MNNFTKSIVYSGVVLAAGLVAIFAIYNNMQTNPTAIEPAAGEVSSDMTSTGETPAADATAASDQATDAAATATDAAADASHGAEHAADAAQEAAKAADTAAEAASDATAAATDANAAATDAAKAADAADAAAPTAEGEPSAGTETTPSETPAAH